MGGLAGVLSCLQTSVWYSIQTQPITDVLREAHTHSIDTVAFHVFL